MITERQKELIKGTVPILKEHGVALTTYFYKRMFHANPELKNVFNMGHQQSGKQQTALAMAVLAYAENIDNPSVLINALTKIGHKHTSLEIRPEHYKIVGNHLLASIGEVLGNAASSELLEAWKTAYDQLAQIMIDLEGSMYKAAIDKTGGWTGWRPFIVKDKIQESEEITSFYLYPSDGGTVADFEPGQYISVRVFLPELNLIQPRQYSISNAPNGFFYRISVKREAEISKRPEGMVSNYLHHKIEVGAMLEVTSPSGDFTLDLRKTNPVVFISGGVGQTPFISMLDHLVKHKSIRKISWIHGCRNENLHAFKKFLKSNPETSQVNTIFFYENNNSENNNHCHEGMVDLNQLNNKDFLKAADVYLCGPTPFIKKQFYDLIALGVPKENIHYEEFGPNTIDLKE